MINKHLASPEYMLAESPVAKYYRFCELGFASSPKTVWPRKGESFSPEILELFSKTTEAIRHHHLEEYFSISG